MLIFLNFFSVTYCNTYSQRKVNNKSMLWKLLHCIRIYSNINNVIFLFFYGKNSLTETYK